MSPPSLSPAGGTRTRWYARRAVTRIALLSDRAAAEALPAILALGEDVKTERLGSEGAARLPDLGPSAVLIDAVTDPDRAFRVLAESPRVRRLAPAIVILGPGGFDRIPWERVADDVIAADAGPAELRLRLTLAALRAGNAGETVLRVGPLAIDTETYQVSVAGRVLDLTYKEFELLRFLAEHPGRVFTRAALLQEVWGYDFYGGTRTVDVHVRRLRAKLGVEHEGLIDTVRGVGYRASELGGL
jgi:DNA-binding response OmpR family regulator